MVIFTGCRGDSYFTAGLKTAHHLIFSFHQNFSIRFIWFCQVKGKKDASLVLMISWMNIYEE
jgi:hypothetical protein